MKRDIPIGFALLAAADVMVQGVEQKTWRPQVDVRRSLYMGCTGALINGVLLHQWFKLLERYIPSTKAADIGKKLVADQLLYAPVSIALFLGLTAPGAGVLAPPASYETPTPRSPIAPASDLAPTEDPHTAAAHVRANMWEVWTTDCMVWPLANTINFRFVPLRHRVLFTSLVDLGWSAYLCHVTTAPSSSAVLHPTVPLQFVE